MPIYECKLCMYNTDEKGNLNRHMKSKNIQKKMKYKNCITSQRQRKLVIKF